MVRAGAQEGGAPEGLLFHVPLPAPSPPGSCPTRKVTVAFLLVGPSAAGDTTVAMGTTPGYFVLRWEKNCLLLSSGPAKGPTFYNRWKLFLLFPGVRVGRAGISLESWGPKIPGPALAPTCFEMRLHCSGLTCGIGGCLTCGIGGTARCLPEGRALLAWPSGVADSGRQQKLPEVRSTTRLLAAGVLRSLGSLAAQPYKDWSTEWGELSFSLQAEPAPGWDRAGADPWFHPPHALSARTSPGSCRMLNGVCRCRKHRL